MNYSNAIFEKAFGRFDELICSDLPEICFSGRSNVGKSSLINRILNRKSLARTSSTPGKTITINFYRVDGFRLVDLPGYGYAKVSDSERKRWSELMEGYFKSGRNICMVFQLIDMRHPPAEFDLSMLEFLHEMKIPYTIVLTKCDKLNKTETEKRLSSIGGELGKYADSADIIPFSALKGTGADQIRAIIENCIQK